MSFARLPLPCIFVPGGPKPDSLPIEPILTECAIIVNPSRLIDQHTLSMFLVLAPLASITVPCTSVCLSTVAMVFIILPCAHIDRSVFVNHAPAAIFLPVDDVALKDVAVVPDLHTPSILNFSVCEPLADIPHPVLFQSGHWSKFKLLACQRLLDFLIVKVELSKLFKFVLKHIHICYDVRVYACYVALRVIVGFDGLTRAFVLF